MKSLVRAVVLAVSSLVVVSCATMGSTPCESCNYAYVPVKKSSERQVFCEINGKRVDCKKTPAECPECAKHSPAK